MSSHLKVMQVRQVLLDLLDLLGQRDRKVLVDLRAHKGLLLLPDHRDPQERQVEPVLLVPPEQRVLLVQMAQMEAQERQEPQERQEQLVLLDLLVLLDQVEKMVMMEQPDLRVLPVPQEHKEQQVHKERQDRLAQPEHSVGLHSNTISPHLLLLLTPAQVISD